MSDTADEVMGEEKRNNRKKVETRLTEILT